MALTLLNIAVSMVVAIILWPLASLTQNYLRVRPLGLPILLTPFGRLNPLWIITQPYLAPLFTWLSTLGGPFAIFNFVHYSTNSWFFFSRHTLHLRYGSAFFIISPGETQLIIADAATADDVQSRRKDFLKNETMYKPLEILGPNVVTVNGDAWARHRRITTPPFNERNSLLVWRESLVQADAMLKLWVENGKGLLGGVENTPNDTMALALNVLMAAGFGKKYDFEGGAQAMENGDVMGSYRDALRIVLQNLYRAIMTSMLMGLPSWAMPKKLVEMKGALKEVEEYISTMMEKERAGLSEKGIEGDNLMSVLLKASESEAMGKERSGLSDQEIIGNLFIYNVAGHDTTANTLAYAVTLAATDFGVQDWLREEIIAEFGGEERVQEWEYEKAFHQLKRCLAVMVSFCSQLCVTFSLFQTEC
jgi:cytochrome P450